MGLWVAASILNGSLSYGNDAGVIIIAGLILAAVNTVIKPIVVLLSLPAVLLTLGLFMIVINGFTVWLTGEIYSSLYVRNFGTAMLAGLIVGLVNYLISTILESK